MAMGGVNYYSIGASIDQCLHAVECICCNANARGNPETAFLVLAGHRLILSLGDVLIGDKTHKAVVLVDDREFLDFVLLKNIGCGHEVGLLVGGNEVVFRHNLIDRAVQTTFKAQVTVGNDANEPFVIVDNGNTTDMILRHNVKCLRHS